MDEFMPEAFTMPLPDMIRELQDMGVEQTLISHAEADSRLLAGLYLYVHIEALNMPDPQRDLSQQEEPDDVCHCGHPDCGAC